MAGDQFYLGYGVNLSGFDPIENCQENVIRVARDDNVTETPPALARESGYEQIIVSKQIFEVSAKASASGAAVQPTGLTLSAEAKFSRENTRHRIAQGEMSS